jgi:hypothetical protein
MATFGTFVAGQVLTAAELNTAGAWQDYTPSWTQSATISKTVDWARYTQIGKWVQGSVKMTATSAGTANNKVLVGLPVSASSNNFVVGSMVVYDNGTRYQFGFNIPALFESSTTMSFGMYFTDATSAFASTDIRFGQNSTSGNNGLVVASGDILYIQFSYEAS